MDNKENKKTRKIVITLIIILIVIFIILFKFVSFGYSVKHINYSNDGGQDESSNFGTNLDRDILTGNGLYACNKASRGRWCAALIMADGWEIKSDYPW